MGENESHARGISAQNTCAGCCRDTAGVSHKYRLCLCNTLHTLAHGFTTQLQENSSSSRTEKL